MHCATCGKGCPFPYAYEEGNKSLCSRTCWESYKAQRNQEKRHEHHPGGRTGAPAEKSPDHQGTLGGGVLSPV